MEFLNIPTKNTFHWSCDPLFNELKRLSCFKSFTYENDLKTFKALRSQLCLSHPSINSLSSFQTYHQLLCVLEQKHLSECVAPFVWTLSSSSNERESFENLIFEHACLIYRLACTYHTTAISLCNEKPPNLVQACQYFQLSAGCFRYINDFYIYTKSLDFNENLLKAWEIYCLAEAQTCIFSKANSNNTTSESIIVKILAKVFLLYEDAYKLFKNATGAPSIFVHWTYIQKLFYQTITYQIVSRTSYSLNKYGENISYLRLSLLHCKEALKTKFDFGFNVKVYEKLEKLESSLQFELKRNERDNDFIHLQPEIPVGSFPLLDTVTMVQSITPDVLTDKTAAYPYFSTCLDKEFMDLIEEHEKNILDAAVKSIDCITKEGTEKLFTLMEEIKSVNDNRYITETSNKVMENFIEIKNLGGLEFLRSEASSLDCLIDKVNATYRHCCQALDEIINSVKSSQKMKEKGFYSDVIKLHEEVSLLKVNVENSQNAKDTIQKDISAFGKDIFELSAQSERILSNLAEKKNPNTDQLLLQANSYLAQWDLLKDERNMLKKLGSNDYFNISMYSNHTDIHSLLKCFREAVDAKWNFRRQRERQEIIIQNVEKLKSYLNSFKVQAECCEISKILSFSQETEKKYKFLLQTVRNETEIARELYNIICRAEERYSQYENRYENENRLNKIKLQHSSSNAFNPEIHKIKFKSSKK